MRTLYDHESWPFFLILSYSPPSKLLYPTRNRGDFFFGLKGLWWLITKKVHDMRTCRLFLRDFGLDSVS